MSVKIVKETDGILTILVPTIDFTDPHPGDMAAMKQMVLDCAPEALIQNLEAFAAAADISNPLVAIRIDKLRERIAYARRMSIDGSYDPALIDRANDVRREIIALPLMISGLKSKHGPSNRDDAEDKAYVIKKIQELNKGLTTARTVKEWETCPELASYKRKYKGRDTLRTWIKDALPNTLKTGRPKKPTVIG